MVTEGYDPHLEYRVRAALYCEAIRGVKVSAHDEAFWYRQANFLDALSTDNTSMPPFEHLAKEIGSPVRERLEVARRKIPRLDGYKLHFHIMEIVNQFHNGVLEVGKDFERWKNFGAEMFCHCRMRRATTSLYSPCDPSLRGVQFRLPQIALG